MSLHRFPMTLLVLICLAGCQQGKSAQLREAESTFMSEAEKLDWYGPACEALYLTIERWHKEKGTAVPSADKLALFAKGPLEFTVGGGPYASKRNLEWSAIKLRPIGRDRKDKRFFLYEFELRGTKGQMGVEWPQERPGG